MSEQGQRTPGGRTARAIALPVDLLLAALSVARRGKSLHPHGVVYAARLRVTGATHAPRAAEILSRPGEHAVLVRFSRSLGLPRPLPDLLGVSIRVPNAYGRGGLTLTGLVNGMRRSAYPVSQAAWRRARPGGARLQEEADRRVDEALLEAGVSDGPAAGNGSKLMGELGQAALKGGLSGLAGVAAMTAAEKIEQRLTGRPSSYVPARTLAHLLGLDRPDEDRFARNMAMHWGTGLALGVVRGVMSAANLRGPRASLMHAPIRLSTDQTLENLTGVGAPPWTWPRDELLVDVLHKGVYSLVTGAVADSLVSPLPGSSARRRFPDRRLKGFA